MTGLLSEREHQVLLLIAQGKTQEQVGLILGCAGKTVGVHLDHTRKKLNAVSTPHAVYLEFCQEKVAA